MRLLSMIVPNLLSLDTTGIIVISCFGVALVLLVLIGLIYFFQLKKKRKNSKEKEKKIVFEHSDDKFIEALGGKENISSFELRGQSRLVLTLKDYSKIKRDELNKFYVSRLLEMSDKVILVGENLKPLEDILNNLK